jgi:hypothetical protein
MLLSLDGPVDSHGRAKKTSNQQNQNIERKDVHSLASIFIPIDMQITLIFEISMLPMDFIS